MLEAIQQTIGNLTGSASEDDSLDNNELENTGGNQDSGVTALGIDNATERHVNEYEVNYNASINKNMLVMDFSLTITANSLYSLFLLAALKGITESFSPIPFHIASAAINASLGTALLSSKEVNKKYVIGMMISRIGLTTAVNGVVLGTINERVDISRQTEQKIIQQIDNFNGVKPEITPPLYDMIAGVLGILVAGAFGLKILLGFFTKGET